MRAKDVPLLLTLCTLAGCTADIGGSNDASEHADGASLSENENHDGSARSPEAGRPTDAAADAQSGDGGDLTDSPTEPLATCTRIVEVSNSSELSRAVRKAKAGHCIELSDGDYEFPRIEAEGTAQRPIVIRAARTLGAVVKKGDIELRSAEHVILEGIHFRSAGSVRVVDSEHCRISRFRMERDENDDDTDWLSVSGTSKHTRIDHNDFGPQERVANMVMLAGKGSQVVQHTRIDHNYFHDVRYRGGNGWEAIRAGLSGYTFSSGHTVIEHNLFVRADSDPETISVKSSDNVIRHNTMRETAGQFTLRHGNRNEVYGNYIFGDGVPGSAGIRAYGGDHRIYNNYIADVEGIGIHVDSGKSKDDGGQLTDHKVSYGVEVLFNTIVSARGIQVGGSKALKPRDCTVAFNLLQGSGALLSEGRGTVNTSYADNIVHGGSSSVKKGVRKEDPELEPYGEVLRIGEDSPAIDAAGEGHDYVQHDIEGKTRDVADLGAHERGSESPKYRPLTEDDVGPFAP